MQVIAVMSQKGGIGKTTTSDSIAYILAEECNKRVLVVDADAQGDTSKTFGVYEADGVGMSELLERSVSSGGDVKTSDLIKATDYQNIDVIPANGYLTKTDMILMLKEDQDQVTRFKKAIEEVEHAYDYCICDCGRLMDMVVLNIMMAAELIVAPVKIGGFEIEAIENLKEQVDELITMNENLKIKALMTMKQGNKISKDFEEWLKNDSGYEVFETPIRRTVVSEKATIAMCPLPKFSKRCNASKDYRTLVNEILNGERIDGNFRR